MLNSSAASLGRLTSLIVPFSPALAARLNAMGAVPGPARLKLRSTSAGMPGSPIASRRAPQLISIRRRSRASPRSPRGRRWRQSRASISPRSGAATSGSSSNCRPSKAAPCLPCSASIARWRRATARRNSRAARRALGRAVAAQGKDLGTGLEAEAEGSAEPWAQEAKASLSLKVRSADFGPLLDLKPADTLAQNIGLSSRVQLTGNKLTSDDLDSSSAVRACAAAWR